MTKQCTTCGSQFVADRFLSNKDLCYECRTTPRKDVVFGEFIATVFDVPITFPVAISASKPTAEANHSLSVVGLLTLEK